MESNGAIDESMRGKRSSGGSGGGGGGGGGCGRLCVCVRTNFGERVKGKTKRQNVGDFPPYCKLLLKQQYYG